MITKFKPVSLLLLAFTSGILSLTSSCISINVNGADGTWTTGNYKTIQGNGHLTTQQRDVGMFTAINKNGAVDLRVVKGNTTQVQVTADENLQDYIITSVTYNTLNVYVKDNTGFNTSHPLLVIVTVPNIDKLNQDGSGDVTIDSFSFDNFQLNKNGSGSLVVHADANQLTWNQNGSGDASLTGNIGNGNLTIDGSGNIKLEGMANQLQLSKNGSGDLSAYDMQVKQMHLYKDGSGDAHIMVSDSLDTDMHGSGDIYEKGNPAGNVNVKGSGDFHHVE